MTTPTSEVYSELQKAYDHFNDALFDGQLPSCLITLQRKKSTLGFFSPTRFIKRSGEKTDEIAMNPEWFSISSIPKILSTFVHEQTHLFQHHFGSPGRGRYHNVEWGTIMEVRGLMPSCTGQPGGKRTGDQMTHYIIEGGAFDVACQKLLTDDFTISWLDRFPPYVPSDPVQLDPWNNEDEDQPGDDLDLDDEDLSGLDIEAPKEPTNKSNREKYKCPSCGSQVWGKPGLNIQCGTCEGIPFEVVQ